MSAAKRSRTGRSPSFGDAGGLNQILPSSDPGNPRLYVRTAIRSGGKAMKPSPEAERDPPSVLTMSTPEIVRTGRAAQVDDFLDQCYFCRRRLPHNEDVFMCGPFRAFCSPECRDQQVEFDTKAEEPKKEAPVQPARAMYSKSNNVNGS